ncbi:serine/threonine protein kinase [Actinoplanes sp. TRM 88003]|uniref:non-specific serine/threonine protein kinase n=1 Tax=Paractinoplanes aksuensis TaxID=2939490 RepID=A0ABT1DG67_9ACTN|nr:serine/threonine-protein kinase [Actinoplanes aksuensis]MCO8269822.1 serine/threonine protein kinase [Actinoplanes aksuensis]
MPLIAGRYRLGETLGVGGMGKVWQARDEVLQRDVAIKEVLLPDDLPARERESAHRRTLREARAAARLGHPNVVQVFDVLDVDGRAWIVMAYVPSRSLHEVLRTTGPLDPRRAARVGLELLAALKAAHGAGVDHRDVKPANVLLADDGRVLLTDFGIATIEGDSQISSSDMLIGSPEYMSPERARDGTAGLASDLWSLGATLYAAVEGHSPFHRSSALASLTALAADEPDPPQRAGVLEPVLKGLLRKDPDQRIDAAEAEHLLREASVGAYGHALVPTHPEAVTTADLPAAAPPPPIPTQRAAPEDESVAAPSEEPDNSEGPDSSDLAPPSLESSPSDRALDGQESADPAPPGPEPAATRGGAPQPVVVPPHLGRATPVSLDSEGRPVAKPAARRWLLAAAATVVALIAGLVVWGVTRPDSDRETPPVAGGQVTSAPGTPAASPETSAAASAVAPPPTKAAGSAATTAPADDDDSGSGSGSGLPELPEGWRDYRDQTGFAVYVPEGWTRSREKTMVYFRDSTTGRVLGIDQTRKPAPDPVADWRGKADYRVSIGDFPSYREIHIREVDYFQKAADWEFTFTRNGTRQHVNNRGVITSSKQAYGFYWQTPDSSWTRYRDDLQLVFDSFRPRS